MALSPHEEGRGPDGRASVHVAVNQYWWGARIGALLPEQATLPAACCACWPGWLSAVGP